jgi:hypothetical protein
MLKLSLLVNIQKLYPQTMDNLRRGLHSFFVTGPKNFPIVLNCIKQVLMLELSKTDTLTGFSTGPQVRM